ncbi:MAG: hypothetical protein R3320_02340 [Nitriliruptorales bacterium]|nr:hypothetical protein [Nitriliruptorales bacterium]
MTGIVGLALGTLAWVTALAAVAALLVARKRFRALVWRGLLPGQVGALPVEDVESHEAPRGWKCAQLLLGPDWEQVRLSGISIGGSYRADDEAVCVRKRSHRPPALDCECGFYAFSERDRAVDLLARRCGFDGDVVVRALLEVEFYGTVIEHEEGSRGELQRVLGLWLLPWCADCAAAGRLTRAQMLACDGQPALRLSDWGPGALILQERLHLTVQMLQHWSPLRPVCDGCLTRSEDHPVSLADLAAALRTEVAWLDADVVDPDRVVASHRPRPRSPR